MSDSQKFDLIDLRIIKCHLSTQKREKTAIAPPPFK